MATSVLERKDIIPPDRFEYIARLWDSSTVGMLVFDGDYIHLGTNVTYNWKTGEKISGIKKTQDRINTKLTTNQRNHVKHLLDRIFQEWKKEIGEG